MLQQQIDPNLPRALPDEELTRFTDLLDQVLLDLVTPGTPPLLADGFQLWTGLATIVVVWTGLRIAFSGSFQPWDIVKLVIGLWIPWIMLQLYDTPIPGVGFSFPMMLPAGANAIANQFDADIVNVMYKELAALYEGHRQNIAGAWEDVNFWELGTAIMQALSIALTALLFLPLTLGALTLIFAISMAQVLWAKIALSLLIFLGPIFIPWLVFEPMKFLFWGWFKAMLSYSLYSVIAFGIMRVWCSISLTFINSMNNDIMGVQPSDGIQGMSLIYILAVIPMFVAAVLSTLKIGELATALVNGGGAGGSGFLAIAGNVATMGKAKLAKAAVGGK